MTNDATRASEKALPEINRRNALMLTATGITAVLSGLAVTTATAKAPSISSLIDAHKRAWAAFEATCDHLSDLEDANPMEPTRVQYGRRLLVGLNDDGSQRWKPLYAYSEDEINKKLDRDDDVLRSLWPDSPGIAHKVEQRRERLLGEFREKQAERDAAEAACGITAANEAQVAADDAEGEYLDALIGHQFDSVEDIRLAASYLTDQHRAGNICHSVLVDFVKALAGRSS